MKRMMMLAALLCVAAAGTASAQSRSDDEDFAPTVDEASPRGVAIGVRAGAVMTTPRGGFPSLIIGDSHAGSGAISETHSQTGVGNRYALSALIPFTSTYGVTLELGTLTWSARYSDSGATRPTRFDVQSLQGALTVQANLFHDDRAFKRRGLRSVYLDGGVEVGLTTMGNRVESTAFPDSGGASVAAVGSFENDEPFRHLTAIRAGLGLRFGVDTHLELQVEGSYAYSLNNVFSSDAIRVSDFTVDNLSGMVGVFYRF